MEEALEPIELQVPGKRRVKPPDPPRQAPFIVLPHKAALDETLSDGAFRVLAAVATFVNRAGFTWVGHKRLAQEMHVDRRTITTQMRKLRERGYIEIVRKGWRGHHNNTMRIIYDPTISADDALAITSSQEDCRPPIIKEEQDRMSPEEQKQRIAQMLKGAVKTMNSPQDNRRYQMPASGETLAAKRIKAGMKKPPKPVNTPADKPVDNLWITSDDRGKQVSAKQEEESIEGICNKVFKERIDKEVNNCLQGLLSLREFKELLDEVLARSTAEGLPTPKLGVALDAVLDLYGKRVENALDRLLGDDHAQVDGKVAK